MWEYHRGVGALAVDTCQLVLSSRHQFALALREWPQVVSESNTPFCWWNLCAFSMRNLFNIWIKLFNISLLSIHRKCVRGWWTMFAKYLNSIVQSVLEIWWQTESTSIIVHSIVCIPTGVHLDWPDGPCKQMCTCNKFIILNQKALVVVLIGLIVIVRTENLFKSAFVMAGWAHHFRGSVTIVWRA